MLRLSLIYALMDCSNVIRVEHLQAATAVWDYCDASVRYVFGTKTGNQYADRIIDALNASLKTHVPTINGQYWKMIAEDGNPYPYLSNPRQQYTAFLAAGKTMDVLLTPSNASTTANARYAIFDSRQFDTNNGAQGGGMLAYLDVTPAVVVPPSGNQAPVANNDSFAAVAHPGSSGLTQVVSAPGVLANDTDPNGNPLHTVAATIGRVRLNANGSFTLSPNGSGNGTTGTVSFNYQARDTLNAASGMATVTITVALNKAPTAAADAFSVPRCTVGTGNNCRTTGSGAYVPKTLGLVSNDTDPDTATIDVANQLPFAVARVRPGNTGSGFTTGYSNSGHIVTISGGNVTYTPRRNFSGTYSFQYRVKDKLGKESGSTTSNTNNTGQGWATVTVTVP